MRSKTLILLSIFCLNLSGLAFGADQPYDTIADHGDGALILRKMTHGVDAVGSIAGDENCGSAANVIARVLGLEYQEVYVNLPKGFSHPSDASLQTVPLVSQVAEYVNETILPSFKGAGKSTGTVSPLVHKVGGFAFHTSDDEISLSQFREMVSENIKQAFPVLVVVRTGNIARDFSVRSLPTDVSGFKGSIERLDYLAIVGISKDKKFVQVVTGSGDTQNIKITKLVATNGMMDCAQTNSTLKSLYSFLGKRTKSTIFGGLEAHASAQQIDSLGAFSYITMLPETGNLKKGPKKFKKKKTGGRQPAHTAAAPVEEEDDTSAAAAAVNPWIRVSEERLAKMIAVNSQNSDARGNCGCGPNQAARTLEKTYSECLDACAPYNSITGQVGPMMAPLTGVMNTLAAPGVEYKVQSAPFGAFDREAFIAQVQASLKGDSPVLVLLQKEENSQISGMLKMGARFGLQVKGAIHNLHYMNIVGINRSCTKVLILDTDGTEPKEMTVDKLVQEMNCHITFSTLAELIPYRDMIGSFVRINISNEEIKALPAYSWQIETGTAPAKTAAKKKFRKPTKTAAKIRAEAAEAAEIEAQREAEAQAAMAQAIRKATAKRVAAAKAKKEAEEAAKKAAAKPKAGKKKKGKGKGRAGLNKVKHSLW